MSQAKSNFRRDQALRDAARTNLDNDVEFIKADMERRGLGERLTDYAADASKRTASTAADFSRDNKGSVAGGTALLFAGIAAYIFWDPIMDALNDLLGREPDDEPEQDGLSSIWETHVKSRFGDR